MLRQRHGGFGRNLGLGRRGVDHEDQRLARAFAQIDRRPHGAQVMRAGAGRHDDQFGHRNHALDRHRDGGRRIDHGQLEALLAQHGQVRRESRHGGLGKGGVFRLAFVPPVGQRTLRVDVDQDDRPGASALGLHGEVSGQGRLARSALLRCQCEYAQNQIPLDCGNSNSTCREGSQIVPNLELMAPPPQREDVQAQR